MAATHVIGRASTLIAKLRPVNHVRTFLVRSVAVDGSDAEIVDIVAIADREILVTRPIAVGTVKLMDRACEPLEAA